MLRNAGFTEDEIRESAEAYIASNRSGDVEGLFRWMRAKRPHSH